MWAPTTTMLVLNILPLRMGFHRERVDLMVMSGKRFVVISIPRGGAAPFALL